MSALSAILRSQEGDRLAFWCPGCNTAHGISVGPGGWGYNGNAERPTFTPSVLVRSGHYAVDRNKPSERKGSCWCTFNADPSHEPAPFKCYQCHSFVKDGQIRFLNDCTHDLRGQTVPLPAWPGDKEF